MFCYSPSMKSLTSRVLLYVVALSAVAPAFSQTPPPPVIEVSSVKFNSVHVGGSSDVWYEVEIGIQGRPGSAANNKQFINRVKVTLNLGVFSVKAPVGVKIPDTYYRASAEAVAIEATGSKMAFRFYLPPEIVKRDQLTGDQKFYSVELSADGKTLPPTKTSVSFATLGTSQALDSFRAKISSDASVNDGILVPQYLTLFAFDTSRPGPSFIRSEGVR